MAKTLSNNDKQKLLATGILRYQFFFLGAKIISCLSSQHTGKNLVPKQTNETKEEAS